MSKWNTFTWSDGTKWADANGQSGPRTGEVDRSAYRVSLKVTHTNETWPGSLSSFILQSASAEIGPRPQLPSNYEAFIDRNDNSQRISVRVTQTAGDGVPLFTEGGEALLTEGDDEIWLEGLVPFSIDKIHGLILPRSRRQPTG